MNIKRLIALILALMMISSGALAQVEYIMDVQVSARALDGSLPDLSSYDDITLVFPVWAGNPAPAFHSVLPLLPKEADVMLYLVSAGGATKAKVKEDLMTLFKGAGVRTAEIVDISTDAANQQPSE